MLLCKLGASLIGILLASNWDIQADERTTQYF